MESNSDPLDNLRHALVPFIVLEANSWLLNSSDFTVAMSGFYGLNDMSKDEIEGKADWYSSGKCVFEEPMDDEVENLRQVYADYCMYKAIKKPSRSA